MTRRVSQLDYNEPSIILIGGDKTGTTHPYDWCCSFKEMTDISQKIVFHKEQDNN